MLILRSYSLHISSTATSVISGNTVRVAAYEYPKRPRDESYPQMFSMSTPSDAAMRVQELKMCTGTAALLVNVRQPPLLLSRMCGKRSDFSLTASHLCRLRWATVACSGGRRWSAHGRRGSSIWRRSSCWAQLVRHDSLHSRVTAGLSASVDVYRAFLLVVCRGSHWYHGDRRGVLHDPPSPVHFGVYNVRLRRRWPAVSRKRLRVRVVDGDTAHQCRRHGPHWSPGMVRIGE